MRPIQNYVREFKVFMRKKLQGIPRIDSTYCFDFFLENLLRGHSHKIVTF